MAVGGYFANSCVRKIAKRNTAVAETERVEGATRSAISAMVSRIGAVDDWARKLEFRLSPILTIEIEKLWLQNRPILFVGAIKDIANYDESRYVVLVGSSIISPLLSEMKLKLSLLSAKSSIDSFFKEHQDVFDGLELGVAVVANIRAIRTENVVGKEGGAEVWQIVEGELVDIVPSGQL